MNETRATFTNIGEMMFLHSDGYSEAVVELSEKTAGLTAAGAGLRMETAGYLVRYTDYTGYCGGKHFEVFADALLYTNGMKETFAGKGKMLDAADAAKMSKLRAEYRDCNVAKRAIELSAAIKALREKVSHA